jgi:type IV secretion system protein VirB10
MPEETNSMQQQVQQPSAVKDRATRPAGILPKNTQALVIAGIALVMVGAIVFSGRGAQKPKAKPSPSVPAVTGPSQERIEEYRRQLNEQARKLATEQAKLAQDRQSLGANSTAQMPGTMPTTSAPNYPPAYAQPQQPAERDSVESDRKKREYASLFASNVALTYRRDASQTSAPASQASANNVALPMLPAGLAGFALPVQQEAAQPSNTTQPAHAEGPSNAGNEQQSAAATKRRVERRDREIDKAEGKQHRIFEGTVLESVLTNRLDGSFSGPVNCMLTANIYSRNGQHLLVPQGTRALGEVKRVSNVGQNRLAVVFHRLIMPDGYSVSLDQFQGMNQIGETGLRDKVNHHYIQVFGISLAIGAIAGLAQADTHRGLYQSSSDAYRQGFAESLSQSSLRILDRYLNILPTVTIREGHRVKIYLADDLLLPAYENHRIAGDL